MIFNKKSVLALFGPETGKEYLLKDMIRKLSIRPHQRRAFRQFLNAMVHGDMLRLRKGRFYRLGEGDPNGTLSLEGSEDYDRKDVFRKIFREYEWPGKFSREAVNQAIRGKGVPDPLPEGVEDWRHLPFVTIDPADARDHDDAVAALDRPKGEGIRLAVAIADVGRYVPEGSALERDAQQRATSVYVPGSVHPMLPEELSAGLCSLREMEDRFAMAAFLDYSPTGELEKTTFAEAVIRSRKRMSYEEAQAVLDGETLKDPELAASFDRMNVLFRQLLKAAEKRGALELDIPEAWIRMDDSGAVTDILPRPRLEAHRLVEVFMIAANEAVALHLVQKGLPGLFRVHEDPAPEKIAAFRDLARSLGQPFPEDPLPSAKQINRFLRSIGHEEEGRYLHIMLLRSLKQARYTAVNEGHFGLALAHYCHFTSPIRRYPDLEIHRVLKRMLRKTADRRYVARMRSRLPETGEWCSDQERKAEKIERKARQVVMAEYMGRFLGESFAGTVSGVTEFGLFVQIEEPFVEGLIHISNLRDDYYRYEEERATLVGERTGNVFRLGDRAEVQLVSTDPARGRVDFRFLPQSEEERRKTPKPGRKAAPKRRPIRSKRRIARKRKD